MTTLLWITNSPLQHGGFTKVMKNILKRLPNQDWEKYVMGLHLESSRIETPDYTILPGAHKIERKLRAYCDRLKPEYVVVQGVFEHSDWYSKNIWPGEHKFISYCAVDNDEPPAHVLGSLSRADRVLVPSEFSRKVLWKAGIPSHVVHHGVDLELFKPENKPSRFTYGCMATHTPRKRLDILLDAYSRISKGEHIIGAPIQESYLMIWTNPGDWAGEYPLDTLASRLGLKGKVGFPPAMEQEIGVKDESLSKAYNQWHVQVIPTGGESFCLPYLEALACGIPTVTVDYGSSREILGEGGMYVAPSTRLFSPYGWLALVSARDLAEKMIEARTLLKQGSWPERMERNCREQASKFTWESTMNQFLEALN